jgi:hypothetical protein
VQILSPSLFWAVMGFELRALSQALFPFSHAPSPFCVLIIFETGPCVFAQAGLDCDTPTYYPFPIAGMTGVHYHTQLID